MQSEDVQECIWEGTVPDMPATVTAMVTLSGVNQMVTPVSSLTYRVTLVSDDGGEITPCRRCLRKGKTYSAMFRKLVMRPGPGEHPTFEFDAMIVCDGSTHKSGTRSMRLFIEIYAQ